MTKLSRPFLRYPRGVDVYCSSAGPSTAVSMSSIRCAKSSICVARFSKESATFEVVEILEVTQSDAFIECEADDVALVLK